MTTEEQQPPGGLDPSSVELAKAKQRLRRRISIMGCGCLVVLGILGIVFAVVVYQGAKNLAADFADPEARTQKVLEVLGAEALPEGYHAAMSVNVPLPFEMVVLSDEPWLLEPESTGEDLPVFNGVPGTKLFYYIHIETEDRTGNDPFEREFKSEEKLGQGDLEIHGNRVAWEAHRGLGLRPQGSQEGVFARLRMECEDRETRRAVWFHQGTGGGRVGTPADPQAITGFLNHFKICREPVAESTEDSATGS